jgi:hypothetical protein
MHEILNRIGCVGLVTALVFPFGQLVFPVMAATMGEFQFGAVQAVAVALLGNGLHAALYG